MGRSRRHANSRKGCSSTTSSGVWKRKEVVSLFTEMWRSCKSYTEIRVCNVCVNFVNKVRYYGEAEDKEYHYLFTRLGVHGDLYTNIPLLLSGTYNYVLGKFKAIMKYVQSERFSFVLLFIGRKLLYIRTTENTWKKLDTPRHQVSD